MGGIWGIRALGFEARDVRAVVLESLSNNNNNKSIS